MATLLCNPYAPDFLTCSGLPTPERWYPYGPGLPVRWTLGPAVAPFEVEMPASVPTLRLPSADDELAVALRAGPLAGDMTRAVPEPAAALLLTLVCLAALWRARC